MKIMSLLGSLLMVLLFSVSALAAPVNINKATAEDISKALDGVGPVKAQAIVAYRDSQKGGKIVDKQELKDIKGIGDKTYESIEADVYLDDASMPQ